MLASLIGTSCSSSQSKPWTIYDSYACELNQHPLSHENIDFLYCMIEDGLYADFEATIRGMTMNLKCQSRFNSAFGTFVARDTIYKFTIRIITEKSINLFYDIMKEINHYDRCLDCESFTLKIIKQLILKFDNDERYEWLNRIQTNACKLTNKSDDKYMDCTTSAILEWLKQNNVDDKTYLFVINIMNFDRNTMIKHIYYNEHNIPENVITCLKNFLKRTGKTQKHSKLPSFGTLLLYPDVAQLHTMPLFDEMFHDS